MKQKHWRPKDGRQLEVMGEMTMHGVTKAVEVDMEFVGRADVGRGDRVGFETTFTVNRSDFGMNWGVENGHWAMQPRSCQP